MVNYQVNIPVPWILRGAPKNLEEFPGFPGRSGADLAAHAEVRRIAKVPALTDTISRVDRPQCQRPQFWWLFWKGNWDPTNEGPNKNHDEVFFQPFSEFPAKVKVNSFVKGQESFRVILLEYHSLMCVEHVELVKTEVFQRKF